MKLLLLVVLGLMRTAHKCIKSASLKVIFIKLRSIVELWRASWERASVVNSVIRFFVFSKLKALALHPVKRRICCVLECSSRNPNETLEKYGLSSKFVCKQRSKTASSTLSLTNKRLIGLYLLCVKAGRGAFGNITTFATEKSREHLRMNGRA
ncbi:hypothetical protein Zmor_008917 [Zophobas morio]|jgi:hypothetical protein|uniref:Secreted protein n=1 Tax=Zophobas morio TaxID=2755281 RepID=A0AA38LZ37_9CUCU|nr:hypothetical protein Zmor_008917 [Zophobas morio]